LTDRSGRTDSRERERLRKEGIEEKKERDRKRGREKDKSGE
jgi:hypothetical protein